MENQGGNEASMVGSSSELPPTVKNNGDDGCNGEKFQCSICKNLLYKPVVLECGHVFCFWCVRYSMDDRRHSSCSKCRKKYQYFPRICWLLHNLLRKKDPVAYKRREEETLEMEKKNDCFSQKPSETSPSAEGVKEGIEASDLLCDACRRILFRPCVLNCGHTYCELCLPLQMNKTIKCLICKMFHPGNYPLVCLELEEFLKKHFPLEYDQREEFFQLKTAQLVDLLQSYGISSSENVIGRSARLQRDVYVHVEEDLSNVHIAVCCELCGMYPILGKRYKCQDCKERIGFDMCELCYDSPLRLPGRFNQQHTRDHVLLLDNSRKLDNLPKSQAENDDET